MTMGINNCYVPGWSGWTEQCWTEELGAGCSRGGWKVEVWDPGESAPSATSPDNWEKETGKQRIGWEARCISLTE